MSAYYLFVSSQSAYQFFLLFHQDFFASLTKSKTRYGI